jgi:hypothetical protein
MPKRYKVVGGSGFTWEYVDDDKNLLLAESFEHWETEDEVEEAIKEMKRAEVKRGRDGKDKPPKPTG